ncbi:MAG: 4'-phosphopantetheinyl transferase family protein [Flavobacterium sp.]
MPLYKSEEVLPGTRLLIWKITESEETLGAVSLKEACLGRIGRMKSSQHRRGFLSVRWLLHEAGYTDFDLHYDADGKPYLEDGNYISITHSYGFSAIIVGDRNVGIDMELRREKVITIADKFIDREFAYLDPIHLDTYMHMLIVIWGVKEAVFKMISRDGLSFKQHMDVLPFDYAEGKGNATVTFEELANSYSFFFEEIEDFTLVYSLENN